MYTLILVQCGHTLLVTGCIFVFLSPGVGLRAAPVLVGTWAVCGWYMDGTWMVRGWYMDGT